MDREEQNQFAFDVDWVLGAASLSLRPERCASETLELRTKSFARRHAIENRYVARSKRFFLSTKLFSGAIEFATPFSLVAAREVSLSAMRAKIDMPHMVKRSQILVFDNEKTRQIETSILEVFGECFGHDNPINVDNHSND